MTKKLQRTMILFLGLLAVALWGYVIIKPSLSAVPCYPNCVSEGFSGRNLRKQSLPGVDFSKADLGQADLSWADLSGADLTAANLRGARLNGANLRGANLTGVDLRGAKLIGAYMEGADLSAANLSGAVLTRVNLAGVRLDGTVFEGARLIGAVLDGAKLNGANLKRVNLTGASLVSAELKGCDLSSSLLYGTDLYRAALQGAILSSSDLGGSNLAGAGLSGADLSYAFAGGCDMMVANLNGATMWWTFLSGSNLDGASMQNVYLPNAWLNGTTLIGTDLAGAKFSELVDVPQSDGSEGSANQAMQMFVTAELNGASFDRANLRRAYMAGATLRGGSLNGTDLEDAILDEMLMLNGQQVEHKINLLGVETNDQTRWPQTESPETQTTALTLGSWHPEDAAQMERFLAAFHERYPQITVVYRPVSAVEYNTSLRQQLEQGDAPDVFYLRSYATSKALFEQGYLQPLDDLIPLDINFSPTSREPWADRMGTPYGVPLMATSHGIYYNQTLFEQLGLSKPTTWEELLNVAQRIKAAGFTPFANGSKDAWTMAELVFMNLAPNFIGGREGRLAYLAGQRCFNDKYAVSAFQAVASLVPFFPNNQAELSYADSQALFLSGQAAMMLDGSWDVPYFEAAQPAFEWGIFAVPPPAGQAAYLTFQLEAAVGLNAASKNKAAAMVFLEWLATPEAGEWLANDLSGYFPLHEQQPKIDNAHAQAFLDLNAGRKTDVRWAWPLLLEGSPNGYELMQNGALGVLNGQLTPQEAAQALQDGLATWFEPARLCAGVSAPPGVSATPELTATQKVTP